MNISDIELILINFDYCGFTSCYHQALALISASTSHSHDLYTKIYLKVDKVNFWGKEAFRITKSYIMSMFIIVYSCSAWIAAITKQREAHQEARNAHWPCLQPTWLNIQATQVWKKHSCCTISLPQVFTQADRRQYQRVGAFQNLGVIGTEHKTRSNYFWCQGSYHCHMIFCWKCEKVCLISPPGTWSYQDTVGPSCAQVVDSLPLCNQFETKSNTMHAQGLRSILPPNVCLKQKLKWQLRALIL